ncbi:sensor histidine kinase [Chryseobacterium sp. CBSDS_008]|uniref:sensor histidine kinase n=1 Tax=Chryseobacterium sp. CBSDS_008 TaxID=3415265 RepID=UPI003CF7C295
MKNRLIFIILLAFLKLHAQSELIWQNYTIDNGLPQNSVKDIINDKYGFIWISTENGITRFDGSQFMTVKNHYNQARYTNFWGSIEKDSIFNVDETGKTTLFITGRKLLKKPMPTKYFTLTVNYNGRRYKLYNKNSIVTPRMDKERLCIHAGQYIYFLDKDCFTYYNPATNIGTTIKVPFNMVLVKNIFMSDNNLFMTVSGYKKVFKISNGLISQVESSPQHTNPQSVIFWSQGTRQVYMVNKDILYKSIYRNGQLIAEKIAHIPQINKRLGLLYITSIVHNKGNGHVFLGSPTKGLYIITLPQFSTPSSESLFTGNVFYATLPFDSHSVITPQGNIYDSISQIITQHKTDNKDVFNDYNKYSLAINKAKDIFFIKNDILYKRLKAYQYDKYRTVPVHEEMDAVYSKDGQLYIVYIKNDKYYLSEYNDQLQKTTPLFYFNYPVNDIKKYFGQQLLIGGLNGLYLGNHSKKQIKKLLDYPVKKIIQTSDRNIWIVTKNHGFFLLKKDRLIRMPLDENSYILDTHTILEDNQHNLWISTNNGLFKVKMQSLLQYSDHRNQPVGYYRYTTADGLPTNELNGGGNPNGNILSNGQMVFPSLNGLVFFRPDKVKSFYLKATDFYIDRAYLDGRQVNIKDNTLHIVNDNFKTLEIFMDFPYFNNLNNVDLHVSTDGNQWIDLGIQRKYTLEKLTPGKHKVVFRYLGSNNNYIYKTVDVKIGLFFYQSLYFKASVIAAMAFLAFLLIKFNDRKLKSRNDLLEKANTEINAQKEEINSSNIIREKLIEAISHDIATPIKHLSHLSKKLNETDSLEIQKKYFHSIHRSSELLYRFTLELGNYAFLFSSKIEESVPYLLNKLIMEKKTFFENIAQDNNTAITFIPKNDLYIQTNSSVLAAIVHNILDNAVKNTSDGNIIIDTDCDDSFIYIQITDDGKGMSPDQIYYYNNLHSILIGDVELQKKGSGYGLKFVLLLIDKIKSQITFNNNFPRGTVVEIKIPK